MERVTHYYKFNHVIIFYPELISIVNDSFA